MSLQTETRQLAILFSIGLLTIITTIAALWVSPLLFVDDTSALYRYMILKLPAILWDVFVLVGSVVIFDYITPEDTLAAINQNAIAATILYSALLLAVSIAIAFG
jgi:hypothetical protein